MGTRSWVAALALPALFVACTTSDSASAPDSGPAELDAGGPLARPLGCTSSGVGNEPYPGPELFEAMRVTAGFDYLERRPVGIAGKVFDAGTSLAVGTECGGATDAAACRAALGALASTEALFQFEQDTAGHLLAGYYFAFSKGNMTGKLASLTELRAVLPVVTSPVIAYAYAEANAHRVLCQTNWVREETDGYVVLADHGPPCGRAREVIFVKRDGTIDVRQSIPGASPCL